MKIALVHDTLEIQIDVHADTTLLHLTAED